MEHPSKRQRLSDAVNRSGDNERDNGGMRTKSIQDIRHHHATPTVGVVQTITASVLDVIIDNGSSAVAAITLSAIPTEPTVIAIPTLGSLMVPAYPLSASSIGTQPIETIAPSNAGSQTPASSVGAPSQSSAAPAGQSSLSIQVPNVSSQAVLSSPPSTPLPSSQTMSLPSASSDSYFPSSTTEAAATSGESSTIVTSTSASFPSFTPIGNFSTATFTITNSGSTFTGTTTLQLGPSTSNLTRPATTFSTDNSNSFITTVSTGSASSTGASESLQTSDFATLTSSSLTATSISASSTGSSTAGTGAGEGVSGSPAGAGTGTSGTPPSASTAAAAGGSNQSNAPPTPAVVGGVVGGLAGLAILLLLILYLFRWRRRKIRSGQIRNGDTELANTNPTPSEGLMAERSSSTPLATAGLAPFLRRLRPHSAQTSATTETAPSERGFQNLGGRRIESVLSSGGDGYGDPGPSNRENLAGSSFYRDSQGVTYGGPGSVPSSTDVGPSSPPTSPNLVGGPGAGSSRPPEPPAQYSDKEVAVMRPGPARTPVTSQGGFTPPPPRSTPPPRATPSPRPPPSRDGVGRSHPSFDGSRGSRFAENLG